MKIKVNKTTNFFDVISACYETDPDLLERYHVLAPVDLQTAINHTVQQFLKSSEMGFYTMYELRIDGNLVGYFGREVPHKNMQLLCGFFILPKYRTKEVMLKFWRIVRSKFEKEIWTYIFDKNTRAVQYLTKKGFIFVGREYIAHEQQYAIFLKL